MRIPREVREMIRTDHVVQVATSDPQGIPHIAAAKGLQILDEEHLVFENWFCFQTLENLSSNPHVAVSILNPGGENGYQLVGTVERTSATEMLDGHIPGEFERFGAIPQTKTQLQVKVEKVLELSTGPHADDV
ncbi:MAG: pyridoxamine 5'-phosphate oxidase family protein [Candidatus Abyssobacteria bacterium SURF_17]|uniref:Pyridoxamine 5'-phosphate oxidase family protein n=1 Tax=Candidatus Abyssobacteria bacterium SURF_17 TaxID=2093361 RepID=A0A419EPN4_9BACT|nr:MAG: pyridoxamine 5'-phosphate oxidase family protein [Candidatus Abyssubacteria bacterium SURF_17]